MEKTIQMMKDNGLFHSFVKQMTTHGSTKEALAVVIDNVCEIDENFEETFFNDLHELGLCIIWEELRAEANRVCEIEAKKQETVEDLLKKIIDLLSK